MICETFHLFSSIHVSHAHVDEHGPGFVGFGWIWGKTISRLPEIGVALNHPFKCDFQLVGGIPTPLKDMSSSVGIMKFPIYGKSQKPF